MWVWTLQNNWSDHKSHTPHACSDSDVLAHVHVCSSCKIRISYRPWDLPITGTSLINNIIIIQLTAFWCPRSNPRGPQFNSKEISWGNVPPGAVYFAHCVSYGQLPPPHMHVPPNITSCVYMKPWTCIITILILIGGTSILWVELENAELDKIRQHSTVDTQQKKVWWNVYTMKHLIDSCMINSQNRSTSLV